jgi:hypothetical protein
MAFVEFLCNENLKKRFHLTYVTDIFGKLNELKAGMQRIFKTNQQLSDQISEIQSTVILAQLTCQ